MLRKSFFLNVLVLFTLNLNAQNFTLVSPLYASYQDTKIVFFQWNQYESSSVNLIISSDASFIDIVYSEISDTNSTEVEMATNGTFYWKIMALTGEDLSPIGLFTIFSPYSIPSLKFWLNPDSGVFLDANGFLEEWIDQGPLNINLNQSVESRRPKYLLMPFPTFYFDGGDRFENILVNVGNSYSIFSLVQRPFNDAILEAENGGYLIYENFHNTGGASFNLGIAAVSDTFMIETLLRRDTGVIRQENLLIDGISSQTSDLELSINNIGGPGSFRLRGYLSELLIVGNIDQNKINDINSYIKFKYAPPVNLSFDIFTSSFCDTSISAGKKFINYLWSTGSTDSVITVTQPGKYWVLVEDIFGFTSSDTTLVIYPGNYLQSFQLCQGQDSIWDTQLNNSDYTFLWQDGSTDSVMVMDESGAYYLTVTDSLGCTYTTDMVFFIENTYASTTSLPTNPILCQNGPLSLITGAEETVSYQWFNTDSPTIPISTEPEIFPTESGWYWVEAINEIGCVAIDSTFVTYFGDIPSPLPGFEWGLACENDAVQFADTTVWEQSPITGWQWLTDSGQTSTEQNPQFVFEVWGEHVVTLVVENETGCQAFTKDTVTVYPKPVVNYTLAQNLCTNTPLLFVDSSSIAEGALAGFTWQFDGDTVVSDTSWVTYEFQSDGEHSLMQIVTSDSGCADTLLSTFPLRNSPVGSFATDTVCFGYPVTAMAYSDTSGVGPTIFEWRDGQGNYLGGFPELSIATGEGTDYNQGGQYGLDLMVHTVDLYCADTTFGSFTLEEPPAIQVISEQSCVGEEIVLQGLISGVTNQVITSWNWYLEDGTSGSDSTISFTPIDTGYVSYQLITETQIAGCTSIISDSIYVYGFPHAQIQAEAFPCINAETILKAIGNDTADYASLNYHWEIGGEEYPIQDTVIMPVYTIPGEYTVGLTVTNSGNCASYDQLDFYTVFGAQANFSASQACAGEITELIALPDTLYSGSTQSEWFLTNDTLFGHSVVIELGGGGFYEVVNQITDIQHGCIDWDTALVKVSDLPSALYAAYTGCAGDAFTLVSFSEDGNDPINITKWSSPFGQTIGETVSLQFNEPGIYPVSLVVITEEASCIDTLTLDQNINVRPNPAFTFSPETGQPPLEVNFSNQTSDAVNYMWNFGSGDTSFDAQPTYTYIDTGWFEITLNAINEFGCTNQLSDSILINPPRVDIEIVDIIPEWDGQFLTVRSLVLNNGYYTVTEFETYISVGSGTPAKTLEVIDIERNLAVLTEPSTAFYVDKNTQAFVCVELKLSGGVKDENPNNDKLCKTFGENEFEVYAPFPNPTTNKLSTRLILPADGEFSIEIYSSDGKMVKGLTFNGGEGFNQVDLYVADLRAGNYRMKVIYDEEVSVFSWVKG